MTHGNAVKDQVVERYFLGELPPEEISAFEEHYFSCPECAADVRMTAAFRDTLRQIPARHDRRKANAFAGFAGTLWVWLSSRPAWGVAAMLLCVVSWQQAIRIPRLERQAELAATPRALPSLVLRSQTRGDAASITLARQEPALLLIFDINASDAGGSYRAELRRENGESIHATSVIASATGDPLHLMIPAATLQPGVYILELRNPSSREPATEYRFTLHRP
jgi:hypothetical protein